MIGPKVSVAPKAIQPGAKRRSREELRALLTRIVHERCSAGEELGSEALLIFARRTKNEEVAQILADKVRETGDLQVRILRQMLRVRDMAAKVVGVMAETTLADFVKALSLK